MKTIKSNGYNVYMGSGRYKKLLDYIQKNKYSKVFLFLDDDTEKYCYPKLQNTCLKEVSMHKIVIPSGESNKNLDTCKYVWETLSNHGADRKSLLINLGGGVVTDLGGFVACTYMRGIDFVNISTTLLSMVDASVGGKTGIDLSGLKNQIGIIRSPKMVLVDTLYLDTLSEEQLRSGVAEMLKHALIKDLKMWQQLTSINLINNKDIDQYIYESIQVKNNIVMEDMYESNIRKKLNLGHTLGHAIETYFINHPQKKDLTHGHAIAIGMILMSYISNDLLGLDIDIVKQIKEEFYKYFDKIDFNRGDITSIMELLIHDKKNSYGDINFVLLSSIATIEISQKVDDQIILRCFERYQEEL